MGKLVLNGKEYISTLPSPFPPLIYSTDEREIGVWTDGKPLYQKTWECTLPAISGSTTGEYVSLINLPDVSVKRVEAYEANGASLYPFTGYSNSKGTQLVNFRYLEGYIKLYDIGVPYSAGEAITVTVKYTKNADTPGSGHWGTDGAPTKHYSTTEQIIGTWIDGKPLYERTIDLGQLPNTNTKVVQTVDVYPDTIVSFEAYAKRHIVGSSKGTFTLPFVSTTLAAQISCYVDIFDDNPSALCVTITTGNDRSNMSGHAIVRYTKTTD